MKVLITGATGVAGLAIYRAALNDPLVSRVTLLTRREIPSWVELPPNAAEKTETILHQDFLEYPSSVMSRIADHDACIWALGKSVAGLKEGEYTVMTHDYVSEALKALIQADVGTEEKPFRFIFVSGELADQTEKSMFMWARVKGRTERELIETCRNTTGLAGHVIRPSYFFPDLPSDRMNLRSRGERVLDVIFSPVLSCLRASFVTPVGDLGTFAVEAAKGRWPHEELFLSARMRELLRSP